MPQLDGKQVKNNSLNGAKVMDAPNGITTGKINADAVDETKLDLSKTYNVETDGGDWRTRDAPSNGKSCVNKNYVDSIAAGVDWKDACRLATNAALSAYTAAGSGVGKTITINATGDLTVDGVKVLLDDRVLVKNEGASHVDHGIYKCTTEGAVGVSAVLTRAVDFDGSPSGEVSAGAASFIAEGTANADTGWLLTTNDPITVDTTALAFTQFTGLGQITAGAGLYKSQPDTIDVGDANKGVQVNADDVQVDAGEIDGDGLAQRAGGGNEHILDVNPGNGLEITGGAGTGGAVKVKPDTTGGAGLATVVDVNANGVAIRIDDDTVKEISDKLEAAVPTLSDKDLTPSATSGDGQDSGLDITSTPAGDSYVRVSVNGLAVCVGNGAKTKDCYFSVDGGVNARALSAITAADSLYWNGAIAGYDLALSDRIDMEYSVAA